MGNVKTTVSKQESYLTEKDIFKAVYCDFWDNCTLV